MFYTLPYHEKKLQLDKILCNALSTSAYFVYLCQQFLSALLTKTLDAGQVAKYK